MSKKEKSKKRIKSPETGGEKLETLVIHGTEYQTLYTTKYRNRRKYEIPDPKKIYSVIPGTVIDVFVKKGQQLREGDPLLILEAMKMRNKVNLHGEGVVRKVNVSVGDKIPKGFVIIELD